MAGKGHTAIVSRDQAPKPIPNVNSGQRNRKKAVWKQCKR